MFIQQRAKRSVFVLMLAILGSASFVHGQQDNVCIPVIGGLAGTPTVDGVVEGDPGWNNAVRLNLSGDLGSSTATKLEMGTSGASLYLGFEVSAPGITADTTVVLVFSPNDGSPADDWRMFITPFATNAPPTGSNQSPAGVTYWKNSSSWNGGGGGTTTSPADWEQANMKVNVISSNSWEMEFQIPIVSSASSTAGFCLSCGAGTFNLYVDVLNTASGLVSGPSVTEDVWPPCPTGATCASVVGPGFLTQITPSSSAWGIGSTTQRAACTGVTLNYLNASGLNVGVQDPTNSSNVITNIQRYTPIAETTVAQCSALADNANSSDNGPPNTFVAIPENTMPTTTAQVNVAFRMANWGIPGSSEFSYLGDPECSPAGSPICAGVNNNPTTQSPINPSSTAKYNSTTWALNYKQSCFYSLSTTTSIGEPMSHQCIQVDMDSNDPNTRFLNKSIQQNMNFVPASTFQQAASISGLQGPLPAGHTKHRFLLQLDLDQQGPCTTDNSGNAANARVAATTAGTGCGPRFRDQGLAGAASRHFGGKVNNLYQWIARGYVYTGNKIVINGHDYEYVRRAGDFGYVAGHAGTVKNWATEFTGSGLNRINSNLYSLEVAPTDHVVVTTKITAEENVQQECLHLFGFSILPLFGGMLILGLMVYRRPPGSNEGNEGNTEPQSKE